MHIYCRLTYERNEKKRFLSLSPHRPDMLHWSPRGGGCWAAASLYYGPAAPGFCVLSKDTSTCSHEEAVIKPLTLGFTDGRSSSWATAAPEKLQGQRGVSLSLLVWKPCTLLQSPPPRDETAFSCPVQLPYSQNVSPSHHCCLLPWHKQSFFQINCIIPLTVQDGVRWDCVELHRRLQKSFVVLLMLYILLY